MSDYSNVPNYTVENTTQEKETREQRTFAFRVLFLPSLIYAVLYTFLLYDNYNSITLPIYSLLTVAYCVYCIKMFQRTLSRGFILYSIGIVLLGISGCLTASAPFQSLNIWGIIVLLFCMMIHTFCDVKNWTITKHFLAFLQLFVGMVECIGDVFLDFFSIGKNREHRKENKIGWVLLGIVCAVPFLFVILLLLCSADVVFRDVTLQIIEDMFSWDWNIAEAFGKIFLTVFVFFCSYCGIRFLAKRKISANVPNTRKLEPVLVNTFLTLVSVVYLLFSVIQIVFLFLGQGKLPSDYTYAEYAREGFFELVFIAFVNVALVLLTLGFFRDNLFTRILLTVVSACTYIMIASSTYKMILYIEQYDLSRQRILALWFLALLAVLLVGVVVLIYKPHFPMFKYLVITVSVFYISLSFSKPDYWIAKYNLSHMKAEDIEYFDIHYVMELSEDAAPVIAQYKGEWVDEYAKDIQENTDTSVRKFNFAKHKALKLFSKK